MPSSLASLASPIPLPPSMTKRKCDDESRTEDNSWDGVFPCNDNEEVAISPKDLETLTEKGGSFGLLLERNGKMVFRRFGIPAPDVCVLKRAAKGTLDPEKLDSLADAAEVLGGFSFLGKVRPTTPKQDIHREYEWKTVYKSDLGCGDHIVEAQMDGCTFASYRLEDDVYHFQKKRKEE